MPAEGVIQLVFRLRVTANPAIPAEAGIQAAAAVALPEGATVRETIQNQVLAELWVPAFAGMAKEARAEIAALIVDSNWITVFSAGVTSDAHMRDGIVRIVNGL